MSKSNIGLIGLAVMGENLVLNMESKGYSVSVFNRTWSVAEKFIEGRARGKNINGFKTIDEFIDSLESPRKIMMMVRAGSAVDELIEALIPKLSKGDILIDGGNSNHEDTTRRVNYVESKGLLYVGAGVSGGEEGALKGPSIMPGGSHEAWPHISRIFYDISAKANDGSPCCEWIGGGGSGHFVKMVHNGIEYGDMQIISEGYHIMKEISAMNNEQIAAAFSEWNKGRMQSYLTEITSKIVNYKDADGDYLLDNILDTAGQKGTGKWSVINAMEHGLPLNLIASAVFERSLSAQKELRIEASDIYSDLSSVSKQLNLNDISDSLYASKLVSYAQGFELLKKASDQFGWNINLSSVALIWRNGCIIRSEFLNKIADAFKANGDLKNILLDSYFVGEIKSSFDGWKRTIAVAAEANIPVPAFSSAYNYFLSFRSGRLPANLIQAQRDFFGAHMFERIDKPRGEFFHENWTGEGGDTSSRIYIV